MIISVICLLLLSSIQIATAIKPLSVKNTIDDEPAAEITIQLEYKIGWNFPWKYHRGFNVEIKDIRVNPLDNLTYHIQFKTSKGYEDFDLESNIPIGSDYSFQYSGSFRTYLFSIYVSAGNVEANRMGIALFGQLFFIT